MSLKRKRTWAALAAVVAPLAFIGGQGSAAGKGSGEGLFGPAYLSTAVVKNGEPHSLVEGTRIRLRFEHDDDSDFATWRSGCNHFGARVNVTPRRLETSRMMSTAMGCSKPFQRQDAWVAKFFRSDPKWERQAKRLKLRSGDDAIRLRRVR